MLPPLPRCSGWAYSSLIPPSRVSLPRKGRRVGLRIVLFEACSAFTRVAACTLARPPIRDPLDRRLQPFRHLHDCSGCFRLERCRVGLAPTGKRRLSRRTPQCRPSSMRHNSLATNKSEVIETISKPPDHHRQSTPIVRSNRDLYISWSDGYAGTSNVLGQTLRLSCFFNSLVSYAGGWGGIRTHEPLRAGGFQDRCLKPLGHPSGRAPSIPHPAVPGTLLPSPADAPLAPALSHAGPTRPEPPAKIAAIT